MTSKSQLVPYFALVAMATMSLGAVFTMLGELRDQLGVSESGLGLMVAMGFFAAFVSQVSLSRFADRGHSKAMIRVGLTLLAAAQVLMVLAEGLAELIVARIALGVGVGLIVPSVRRIVITHDPARVGANLGLLGSFDVSGFVVGPLMAALMVELAGFRSPFVVLAVATIAFIPFVARLPADSGAVGAERRVMRSLLERRAIRASLLAAAGWFAMLGAFESVWAVLLTDRGAATWQIGVTLSIIVFPMIFLAPWGGRIAERHGPVRVVFIGVLAVVPCVFSYGFISSISLLAVVAVLQGLGDSVTFPATQVAAAMAAREDQLASAQGLLGATLELVAGSAALVAGALYDRWGAQVVFTSTAGLMALCVGLAAVISRPLAAAGDRTYYGTAGGRADAGETARAVAGGNP